MNLSTEGFEKFWEFRNERLEVIPMHLLKIEDKLKPTVTINSEGPISRVDSQISTDKILDSGKARDIDNIVDSSRKLAEKQVMSTPTTEISSEVKGSSMEQEWDQFNLKLQDTHKMTNTQETVECKTSLHTEPKYLDKQSKSMDEKSKPMDEQATTSQQIEIITALPILEIVLKVTEILLLDVFYSPHHKVVVRRKRKRKRKRVETLEIPLGNEPMHIVWRDIPFNLAENLTIFSQFTENMKQPPWTKLLKPLLCLGKRRRGLHSSSNSLKQRRQV